MHNPFSRTLQALERDRLSRWPLWFGASWILIWGLWLVLGKIPLYVTTEEARIVAEGKSTSVQSDVEGRIVALNLQLNQNVEAGQVLLELDSEGLKLQRDAARTRNTDLDGQLQILTREIQAGMDAMAAAESAGKYEAAEANATQAQKNVAANLAKDKLQRLAELRKSGAVSEMEYQEAKAAAEKFKSESEGQGFGKSRMKQQRQAELNERQARLQYLRREEAAMLGQMEAAKSELMRLDHEVDRRSIKAPISGRVGDLLDLQVGTVLQAGTSMARIVPAGRLTMQALFPAGSSVGRIRAGQSAEMRLEVFPWTEYGALPARVSRVASEGTDGQIRVELDFDPGANKRLQLQHGLAGEVSIKQETVSPLRLLLRKIGKWTQVKESDAEAG